MPNIELHGFFVPKEGRSLTEDMVVFGDLLAKTTRDIWKMLEGIGYIDDVVISTVFSSVENRKAEPQPYLRLVAPRSSEHQLAEIEQRLRPLNFDVEVMYLERFTPKVTAAAIEKTAQGIRDQLGVAPTPRRNMCD